MRRRTLPLATVAVVAALPAPAAARQSLAELTATPESTTELFLRSVRAIRWSAAAQLMDAGTIGRFHDVVTMVAEADTVGDALRFLTGTDRTGYRSLAPAEVFDRAVGTMIDSMPGLMHAIFDRDDDVIGHVLEAPDTAHVVYRTTARLSGAVSEVKVMQLVRTPAGWRVLWSDELAVLDTALRGIPLRRRPPGGAPAARSGTADVAASAVTRAYVTAMDTLRHPP